jgi:hypothetical protein
MEAGCALTRVTVNAARQQRMVSGSFMEIFANIVLFIIRGARGKVWLFSVFVLRVAGDNAPAYYAACYFVIDL